MPSRNSSLADQAPLGAYVHLPWCVSKCPYCDFNSHALKDQSLPETRYIDALVRDLELEWHNACEHGWQRPVSSVFFGGGTPSLFGAASIERILGAIADRFGLSPNAEITLEANPGAVEWRSFGKLRAAGVNRISLGAQSFDDTALARLGRVHKASETLTAVKALRDAGFDNFNLDLMYALPDQTVAAALGDLEQALALEPTHVSHYQLTLEPNTLFHSQPPELPDDDTAWTMQCQSLERLTNAGFEHYEVSAYSTPGLASQHNLNYWRFGDYLGIGAGAHGKLTHEDGHMERTARQRHPTAYMASDLCSPEARHASTIETASLYFEYPLNQLRLKNEPLSLSDFESATGACRDALMPALNIATRRKLLQTHDDEHYVKTELGWRFLNDLQGLFLLAEETINDLAMTERK